jgi:glycosyltransferase involved in cell wall biosynthesis
VLYNPKYSIPLRAPCPSVWVCHGLDWYVMPWASRFADRLSHRFLVPQYAARAGAIIAVSEVTRRHVLQYLPAPAERVPVVYSGVDDVFRRPVDPGRLRAIRAKYSLPERFLLYAGAIYPPKNYTRLIRAYARVGPERGIPLVIAGGENRFLSEGELREPEALGIGEWVRRPGWVEQEELAAFYAMADALLLPSLFESCGLPVLEAMAAGCPVVTADRYGTKELAEGAAVLVDPEDVDAIAAGIRRILDDASLRDRMIAAGRERSRSFTWERCARDTLAVLERVGARRAPGSSPGRPVAAEAPPR